MNFVLRSLIINAVVGCQRLDGDTFAPAGEHGVVQVRPTQPGRNFSVPNRKVSWRWC